MGDGNEKKLTINWILFTCTAAAAAASSAPPEYTYLFIGRLRECSAHLLTFYRVSREFIKLN